MSTVRKDGAATRAAILDAAEHVFAERGYAGTAIREIANKSGSSAPLIMNHFKNKRGLFQAMKAAIVQRYEQHAVLKEVPEVRDVHDWLERVIRSKFAYYKHNPTIVRLADWCRLEGDTELWPGIKEWHAHYIKLYRQLGERVRNHDEQMPFRILLTISGAIQLWWEFRDQHLADLGEDGDADRADEEYAVMLIEMLGSGLDIL